MVSGQVSKAPAEPQPCATRKDRPSTIACCLPDRIATLWLQSPRDQSPHDEQTPMSLGSPYDQKKGVHLHLSFCSNPNGSATEEKKGKRPKPEPCLHNSKVWGARCSSRICLSFENLRSHPNGTHPEEPNEKLCCDRSGSPIIHHSPFFRESVSSWNPEIRPSST